MRALSVAMVAVTNPAAIYKCHFIYFFNPHDLFYPSSILLNVQPSVGVRRYYICCSATISRHFFDFSITSTEILRNSTAFLFLFFFFLESHSPQNLISAPPPLLLQRSRCNNPHHPPSPGYLPPNTCTPEARARLPWASNLPPCSRLANATTCALFGLFISSGGSKNLRPRPPFKVLSDFLDPPTVCVCVCVSISVIGIYFNNNESVFACLCV